MPEIVRQADYYGLDAEGLDKVSSYDKLAQEELDDLLAGPQITPGYMNY